MVENTRCKTLMIIWRSVIRLAAHTTHNTEKWSCRKEEGRNLSKHDACEERTTAVLKKKNPKQTFRYQKVFGCVCYVFTDEAGEEGGYASWCIFVGYDQNETTTDRCIDPTTKSVSPHLVFDEASSWWSSENVVLPDSGMLDFRMRAQAPRSGQQEPDIVSHSGPESKKSATRSPPVRKKSPRPATRQQRVMHAALEESKKIWKRIRRHCAW